MLMGKDRELADLTLSQAHFIDPEEAKLCQLTSNIQPDIINSYQFRPLEPERNDMPIVEFGEKFSTSRSKFLKLKGVNEKVRLRFLGAPFVEGKHFDQNPDDSWNVTPCPRINEKADCPTCERYFEIMARAKKTGDEKVIKEAKKEARKYQSAISFYFPVLNRDTCEFAIFQSKLSVKNQLEDELAAGTKVLDSDFVVMRTESNGLVRYPVKKVDSSDTPPLTLEEKEEVKKYKTINMEDYVTGQREDEGELAIEEDVVVVKV